MPILHQDKNNAHAGYQQLYQDALLQPAARKYNIIITSTDDPSLKTFQIKLNGDNFSLRPFWSIKLLLLTALGIPAALSIPILLTSTYQLLVLPALVFLFIMIAIIATISFPAFNINISQTGISIGKQSHPWSALTGTFIVEHTAPRYYKGFLVLVMKDGSTRYFALDNFGPLLTAKTKVATAIKHYKPPVQIL